MMVIHFTQLINIYQESPVCWIPGVLGSQGGWAGRDWTSETESFQPESGKVPFQRTVFLHAGWRGPLALLRLSFSFGLWDTWDPKLPNQGSILHPCIGSTGLPGKSLFRVLFELGTKGWVGVYCGEGDGTPLQYSCLENPMDRGAW